MSATEQVLVWLTLQQDYLWFLALLGWILAAGLLIRARSTSALAGNRRIAAGMLIAAGAVHAGTELIAPMVPVWPFYAENIRWDWWVRSAVAGQVMAATWLGLGGQGRRLAAALCGLAAVAALGWRIRSVPESSFLLGLCGAGCALLAIRRPFASESRIGKTIVLAAAATPLLATIGPLAEVTLQARRWTEFSPFAPLSGALQTLLASAAARWCWTLQPPVGWTQADAEFRTLRRSLGWWLAAGFGLAAVSAALARTSYESALKARALAAAAIIDAESVRACLGPMFRPLARPPLLQPSGRKTPAARVPFLATGIAERPRSDLARVERANRDCRWAHLMTLRGDHLVTWALATHMTRDRELITLHHRITPENRIAWTERDTAWIEGPIMGGWGKLVRVAAPVATRDRAMLGWVALDFGVDEWLAVQAQARLMAFALTTAGAILAGMFFLHRLRTLERENARRLAIAAEEADRAKTLFLAKVSHELRTPLQGIMGYAELLTRVPLPPEAGNWLAAVRHQGLFLTRLVNDLVDLAALESGAFRLAPKPHDLGATVQASVDSLRTRAEAKGLGLFCTVDPGIAPCLNVDADRFRQILINLVGNAVKYTAAGRITVQLRPANQASGEAGKAHVELVVSDTGPGISEDDQKRLFKPFARLEVNDGTEGAGLGLALTAALCRSFGGDLTVESDGHSGTTFVARLCLTPAEAPKPDLSGPGEDANLHGVRVLVADDNSLVRELFVSALASRGAVPASAADGLEVVERCASEKFEAVVLDLSMPWLDGFETARRLRAAGHACRIVGVSAHASAHERSQAMACGMDAFLVKPVDLAEFAATVAGRATSSGGRAAPPGLRRRLEAKFVEEADRLGRELQQAATAGDWQLLRARAHYLKNSADIAQLPALSLHCNRVYGMASDLISDRGTAASRASCRQLVAETAALLGSAAKSFASDPGVQTEPKNHTIAP